MRYLFIVLLPILFFSKDINDFLLKNDAVLWNFYQKVKEQSAQQNYPIFSRRFLIDQISYEKLSNEEKKKFFNHLVFIVFYLKDKPLYSDFGGVSVRGMSETYDGDMKEFYYLFDGRYYTDLGNVDRDKRLFAYCVLPNFHHCILLGIGEEW